MRREEALRLLAAQLDELRQRFGVETTAALSISQASSLIDELKSTSNGSGGKR